ncbi:hypothetical protein SCG7086_BJ_00110 [Chlamydiales bacterium SCGC AG-110-P3]|nr:hypothetical protein SCG7086_BJ_00110 [Chlamydiales bacterium SCGC AG-110-P3]
MTKAGSTACAYDVVVVGGGFYGCRLAILARQYFERVLLVEKESDLMQRASFVNQARIHNGYHYPRSLLTAMRSRVNFPRFSNEYKGCVVKNFQKIYAIARHGSKVNARAFERFCARIGAPIEEAPANVSSLFHSSLIEKAFLVTEYAFDSAKLKNLVSEQLHDASVDIRMGTEVNSIQRSAELMAVGLQKEGSEQTITARLVFNCTYSYINSLLSSSISALIPLTHELTEMPLVQVPLDLQDMGITVMDGTFFSVMPFPSKNLHSLSHVRYTPHVCWRDDKDDKLIPSEKIFKEFEKKTRFTHMLKDAQRYIPTLAKSEYRESIWEIKTILPRSETDDSRPILCSRNSSMKNLISVIGGKIDNIYDVEEVVKQVLIES